MSEVSCNSDIKGRQIRQVEAEPFGKADLTESSLSLTLYRKDSRAYPSEDFTNISEGASTAFQLFESSGSSSSWQHQFICQHGSYFLVSHEAGDKMGCLEFKSATLQKDLKNCSELSSLINTNSNYRPNSSASVLGLGTEPGMNDSELRIPFLESSTVFTELHRTSFSPGLIPEVNRVNQVTVLKANPDNQQQSPAIPIVCTNQGASQTVSPKEAFLDYEDVSTRLEGEALRRATHIKLSTSLNQPGQGKQTPNGSTPIRDHENSCLETTLQDVTNDEARDERKNLDVGGTQLQPQPHYLRGSSAFNLPPHCIPKNAIRWSASYTPASQTTPAQSNPGVCMPEVEMDEGNPLRSSAAGAPEETNGVSNFHEADSTLITHASYPTPLQEKLLVPKPKVYDHQKVHIECSNFSSSEEEDTSYETTPVQNHRALSPEVPADIKLFPVTSVYESGDSTNSAHRTQTKPNHRRKNHPLDVDTSKNEALEAEYRSDSEGVSPTSRTGISGSSTRKGLNTVNQEHVHVFDSPSLSAEDFNSSSCSGTLGGGKVRVSKKRGSSLHCEYSHKRSRKNQPRSSFVVKNGNDDYHPTVKRKSIITKHEPTLLRNAASSSSDPDLLATLNCDDGEEMDHKTMLTSALDEESNINEASVTCTVPKYCKSKKPRRTEAQAGGVHLTSLTGKSKLGNSENGKRALRGRSTRTGNSATVSHHATKSVICGHIDKSTGERCETRFKRPYDLVRHRETIHISEHQQGQRKKKWACEDCGGQFSRKDALIRHCRIRGHRAPE